MNRIIFPFRANRYAMNYGYIIMKNNLRTIYDESMGGRPRKKTNAEKTGKMSLRPLFLILFILSGYTIVISHVVFRNATAHNSHRILDKHFLQFLVERFDISIR